MVYHCLNSKPMRSPLEASTEDKVDRLSTGAPAVCLHHSCRHARLSNSHHFLCERHCRAREMQHAILRWSVSLSPTQVADIASIGLQVSERSKVVEHACWNATDTLAIRSWGGKGHA